MADICGSSSIFSRIAYDAGATGAFANFTAASLAFPLADGGTSLSLKQPNVNNSGMSGLTAQSSEQTRQGLKMVDGEINLLATPDILTLFFPHVTGRAMASFVTYPDVVVPSKFHVLLHRDSGLYTYTDLYVTKMVLGSEAGQPLKLTLSVIGRDRETTIQNDTAWPVGLNVSNKAPYMHQDMVITVGGTTYKFKSWQLTIDNKLEPQYFDSVSMCGVQRTDFAMTQLRLVGPHTQATCAAIMQGAVPPAGLNVVITGTHPTAGMSMSVRCQTLQIPIQDPPVAKGTILLDLTGDARRLDGGASGGAEVILTSDNV